MAKDNVPTDISKMIRINLRHQALRAFLAAKGGRLPTTMNELAAWLEEFDDEIFRIAERSQQAFEDHMMTCNRPFFMCGGSR